MNNGLGLLFFFPETLFPPHKGDRGVLEPSGFWNARRAILYCLLAGDIISVLLSPGTPSGLLERAKRIWNCLRPLEQSRRLSLLFGA